jgi:hypothetical protein
VWGRQSRPSRLFRQAHRGAQLPTVPNPFGYTETFPQPHESGPLRSATERTQHGVSGSRFRAQ